MKKFLGLLGIFVMLSCGKTSLNAELGESFKMTSEQSVKINKTDLKFDGFKVIEDSRCPEGANCFWEGQVLAEFGFDGEALKFNSFKPMDTLGYTFLIKSVIPPKIEEVEIPLTDYVLEILITK